MEGLKVLVVGSDRKLFEEGSAVSKRVALQGGVCEEMHVVVFSLQKLGHRERQIAPNVWVYPTNSVSRVFYVRDAAELGRRLVKDKGFIRGKSLITSQDPFESGLAALRVKKVVRLPLLVQLHTDPFSPYFAGVLNRIRQSLSPKVIRNSDGLRVVTSALGDKIAHKFGYDKRKVSVLPVYIDKERIAESRASFDLREKTGYKFVMLVVARLEGEKNISLALRVLEKVSKKHPEAALVVVGSGREEERLKSLAKRLGVEGRVFFEGWQEDTASYYKTANLFLQTSRFEGYGVALAEAGLSGLPAISTPVGLAMDLDKDKEIIICKTDDLECWEEAVSGLIEDNARREVLRHNLKSALNERILSEEEYFKKLREVWERIVSNVDKFFRV